MKIFSRRTFKNKIVETTLHYAKIVFNNVIQRDKTIKDNQFKNDDEFELSQILVRLLLKKTKTGQNRSKIIHLIKDNIKIITSMNKK